MGDSHTTDSAMSLAVIALLEPLLGRFTARKAVEMAAEQCGTTLVALGPASTECMCERLRPVLRTLLGAATAGRILEEIARLSTKAEVES